eukprot:TRINITY_DN5477_c0_g1_i4.p1 TRINITY_DN5477_c0_g1~~TRINITY_DN5477_c0_g1_i4.p1  ORF type:complete len:223 (+),score=11.07 TRINITY_DN5477_c0_g1_i4:209-877(+)
MPLHHLANCILLGYGGTATLLLRYTNKLVSKLVLVIVAAAAIISELLQQGVWKGTGIGNPHLGLELLCAGSLRYADACFITVVLLLKPIRSLRLNDRIVLIGVIFSFIRSVTLHAKDVSTAGDAPHFTAPVISAIRCNLLVPIEFAFVVAIHTKAGHSTTNLVAITCYLVIALRCVLFAFHSSPHRHLLDTYQLLALDVLSSVLIGAVGYLLFKQSAIRKRE